MVDKKEHGLERDQKPYFGMQRSWGFGKGALPPSFGEEGIIGKIGFRVQGSISRFEPGSVGFFPNHRDLRAPFDWSPLC